MTPEMKDDPRLAAAGYMLAGLCVAALLSLQWCAHHGGASVPETFRGSAGSDGRALTEQAVTECVVRGIDDLRAAGFEPEREDFDLPEDWRPAQTWQEPAGFQKPEWWPEEEP